MLIRFAQPGDAEQIAAIYAPFVRDTAVSFETDPPDADEMRRRIAELDGRYPWLVGVDGDTVLGYVYASPHRARPAYRFAVDVSAYVAEHARGRGIGKRLYTDLLEILTRQGFATAYAGIALPNDASIALHRSVGFTLQTVYERIGYKHGQWHDTSWWRRPLRAYDGAPGEPLPPVLLED
jgi:phosphinothricin acetyltransferase